MRALIQRVKRARVTVDDVVIGDISSGLLILLGVEENDTTNEIEWLAGKCVRMRLFPDEMGVMNRSVMEFDGDIMIVSQFTLAADIRKGNRPSYIRAMRPPESEQLYESFCAKIEEMAGKKVQRGRFGADMDIELVNWGPVTIVADTPLT